MFVRRSLAIWEFCHSVSVVQLVIIALTSVLIAGSSLICPYNEISIHFFLLLRYLLVISFVLWDDPTCFGHRNASYWMPLRLWLSSFLSLLYISSIWQWFASCRSPLSRPNSFNLMLPYLRSWLLTILLLLTHLKVISPLRSPN